MTGLATDWQGCASAKTLALLATWRSLRRRSAPTNGHARAINMLIMPAEMRGINASSLSLLISGQPGTKKKQDEKKKRKKNKGNNTYIFWPLIEIFFSSF
jgi:hypothetical protein